MDLLSIGKIGRAYRHAQRYADILSVLLKHGFGDLVQELNVDKYVDLGRKFLDHFPTVGVPADEASTQSDQEAADAATQTDAVAAEDGADKADGEEESALTRPVRLRLALEELGTTFCKVGQILSTRPDLIPAEYLPELEKLQDSVPQFSFEKVREIVERELDGTLEELFLRFDSEPLAAASIGQVHRAWLKDETPVVVKVRRPDIIEKMNVDLEIIAHLGELAEGRVEEWAHHKPSRIARQMVKILSREVDFTHEAARIDRFQEMFADDPNICFPNVYRSHSTSAVLTMEFIDGIKASNMDALKAAEYDLPALAEAGASNVILQIFKHGFFHGDPHPGNIMVLPGGPKDGGRICFLDFGMTGRIERDLREQLADLLYAVTRRDTPQAVSTLLKMTDYDSPPDTGILEGDVAEFVDVNVPSDLALFSLNSFFQGLSEITQEHKLRIPPVIFLMIKALGSMEDLARRLHPNIDIIGLTRPVIEKVQWNRLNPESWSHSLALAASDFLRKMPDIPEDARIILRKLKFGELSVQFEHHGLESVQDTIDKIGARLSVAIVLGGMLVGSAVVIHAGTPPHVFGIPVLGFVGFALSLGMGVALLFSILRQGKH